ncbi:MAG: glycosyltransferase [Chthoniobacterales bacterium]|nr:glycosyltransferase [Chthoniobacterales bacterium]
MPGSEMAPDGWPGWPDGRKFGLVLTHDVEGSGGLEKCGELAQIERDLGFRSSFNFIPEGEYRVSAGMRVALVRDGFEVAVHDLKHDGQLYSSRRDFARRAARINGYLREWGACGFRSGFMLHNLAWLHELEIKYDLSTFDTDPFEPQPDGRHTIFPFLVPRLHGTNGYDASKPEGYVELPYTLPQDSTLFLLLRESTPEIWMRKLDWVAAHGGMVLVNTHPDYMYFSQAARRPMQYPVELYKQLLRYISDKYAGEFWPALPRDAAAYISERRTAAAGVVRGAWPTPPTPARRSGSAAISSSVIVPPNGDFAHPYLDNGRSGEAFQDIEPAEPAAWDRLRGKRGAVLLFSHYPADPRPRRAAEALAQQGMTIDLICLQEDAGESRREEVNGVKILRIPLKRRRRGKISYAWQYSAFIGVCLGYLAGRSLFRRYDFVHVHNMPDILVFSALVPKLLGAKIVLDLHDPMPELMEAIFELSEQSTNVRALRLMEKGSIAFSDHVVTVSQTFKKLFSSRSCSPGKITVVLNAPDERIFPFQSPAATSTGSSPEKPFVVLYHGSLLRRNGLDLAIDALELVRREVPTAILHVCGKPTDFFDEVMTSVAKRGLAPAVRYLGAKDLEGIVDAIQHCDVGVIPNHHNKFTELNTPTRIFECLALGRPVIAPRARGIQDYFDEEEIIYFELGNVLDLAEKIRYTYFHPHEVGQITKRGQEIYQRHTWKSEKANLLNAFADLV